MIIKQRNENSNGIGLPVRSYDTYGPWGFFPDFLYVARSAIGSYPTLTTVGLRKGALPMDDKFVVSKWLFQAHPEGDDLRDFLKGARPGKTFSWRIPHYRNPEEHM